MPKQSEEDKLDATLTLKCRSESLKEWKKMFRTKHYGHAVGMRIWLDEGAERIKKAKENPDKQFLLP